MKKRREFIRLAEQIPSGVCHLESTTNCLPR